MAIHLGRPSPNASCGLPGRRRENTPGPKRPVPPLFGLAPGGVYRRRRRCRRRGALLPHPFTLTRLRLERLRRAVCFLWHCPWGRPRRALPGTVFPWSPDFPHPARGRSAAIRPSGNKSLSRGRFPGQATSCDPIGTMNDRSGNFTAVNFIQDLCVFAP